jgi:hypothetical protein
LLQIVLLTCISLGCKSTESRQAPPKLPPELVVATGARDIVSGARPDGAIELTNRLDEPFPAENLLRQVRAAFPADQWHPLAKDWLNPEIPTSHSRGWTDFQDGTKHPETWVHAWSADWRDSKGNMVLYSLRYDSKPPYVEARRPIIVSDPALLAPPDNSDLRVSAAWFPVEVVNRLRKAAGVTAPIE